MGTEYPVFRSGSLQIDVCEQSNVFDLTITRGNLEDESENPCYVTAEISKLSAMQIARLGTELIKVAGYWTSKTEQNEIKDGLRRVLSETGIGPVDPPASDINERSNAWRRL